MRRANYFDGTSSGYNINAWNSKVKSSNSPYISYTGAETIQIFSAVVLSTFRNMSHNKKKINSSTDVLRVRTSKKQCLNFVPMYIHGKITIELDYS